MKIEDPVTYLQEALEEAQRYVKSGVPRRLPDPLDSADLGPQRIAVSMQQRLAKLELDNALRAGTHWAAYFATAPELAFLEELATARGPMPWRRVHQLVRSYEEALRRECGFSERPDFDLHAVVLRVLKEPIEESVGMLNAFADGALGVWISVKPYLSEQIAKAGETSKVS